MLLCDGIAKQGDSRDGIEQQARTFAIEILGVTDPVKISYLTKLLVFVFFFTTISSSSSWAASFTFNENVDLSTVSTIDHNTENLQFDAFIFAGILPTFTLAVGDTISGTLSFGGGQSITTTNVPGGLSFGDVLFQGSTNIATNGGQTSSTITLDGTSGYPSPSPPNSTTGDLNGVIYAESSPLTTSSVTFTGFTYSLTLNTLTGPNTFTPESFQIVGDTVTVNGVPEPSTLAMILVTGSALLCYCAMGQIQRLREFS